MPHQILRKMERMDSNFNQEENEKQEQEMMREWDRKHRRGKVAAGLIIIAIGGLFLGREMGLLIPQWIFSWKVLSITIGIYVGIKHAFRGAGWLVPIFVGIAFLLRDNFPQLALSHYLWPIAIIFVGLMILFKPRRRKHCRNHHYYKKWHQHRNAQWAYAGEKRNSDNYLEINSVFAGTEKRIISKDFKGGEINTVFGGVEADMSQADITGRIELEVNTVFGGTKLIVPANWEIKSEITAVLGSVEDKRIVQRDPLPGNEKVVVLRGNVVFGGIEIQSY